MGETVKLKCLACGYESTADVGTTMSGQRPHNSDPPVDLHNANKCPQCGELALWAGDVEMYWD